MFFTFPGNRVNLTGIDPSSDFNSNIYLLRGSVVKTKAVKETAKSYFRQVRVESLKQVLWNLFLISLGSSLCAIAINGILIPQKFLT